MKVENLFAKFKTQERFDLKIGTENHGGLLGNSFQIDITEMPIETFKQRIELIDKATEIEDKRLEIENQNLIDDETKYPITRLKKIGNKWIEFDFEYGKEMLLNAIRYDLAYSSSERVSIEFSEKFHNMIMSNYKKENTFIYCNYNKSPWDKKSSGYSGCNLTDNWTFDLGIVLINSSKLTFNYFLSED